MKLIQRTVAVCAIAAACIAPAANASVISVSFGNAPVAVPSTIDGMYFNFVTGAYSTTEFAGYDFNPYNNNTGLTFYGNVSPSGIMASGTPGTSAQALALTFGTLISSAGQFNQYQTLGTNFRVTGEEYVGLRFLNEATGVINYGWALMSTTASSGFPSSVLAYGYENTGLSILAGQTADSTNPVPEPASLAILGLGLIGLAAARRRKAA